MSTITDTEPREVAAVMLSSVPRLTRDALNIRNATYEVLDNGDVVTSFSIGSDNWRKIRKAAVTYSFGRDLYDVEITVGTLDLNAAGTGLTTEVVYSSDDAYGVYGDMLGEILVHGARKAGLRPRI